MFRFRLPLLRVLLVLWSTWAPAVLVSAILAAVTSAAAASAAPAGATQDWWARKQTLYDERGIGFGVSYNVLGQFLDSDRSSRTSAGGVFEAVFSWTLRGEEDGNHGTFVMLVENQHALGSGPSPAVAGLLAGSLLPTASFAEFGWHVNQLMWSQGLLGGRLAFDVGLLDTIDYVDVAPFSDPLTGFSHFAFAGTPTIPLPVPGPGLIVTLADRGARLALGVADGGTRAGSFDPGDYFGDGTLFRYLELGVGPGFADWPIEQAQITIWQHDPIETTEERADRGVALTLTGRFSDRLVPFVRAGWSRGTATGVDRTATVGFGLERHQGRLLGMAVNASRAVEGRTQTTTEVFYRLGVGSHVVITPHVGYTWNPVLDHRADGLLVLGLRLRAAL